MSLSEIDLSQALVQQHDVIGFGDYLTYARVDDVVAAANRSKVKRVHDWSIRRGCVVMPERPAR